MATITTNKLIVNPWGFAIINLMVGNMRKVQQFTLYPYTGGDKIILQSDKRFAEVNLRTGAGRMNKENRNYNGYASLMLGTVNIQLTDEAIQSIQEYLWRMDGADGGNSCISWANKPLFSEQ